MLEKLKSMTTVAGGWIPLQNLRTYDSFTAACEYFVTSESVMFQREEGFTDSKTFLVHNKSKIFDEFSEIGNKREFSQ